MEKERGETERCETGKEVENETCLLSQPANAAASTPMTALQLQFKTVEACVFMAAMMPKKTQCGKLQKIKPPP